MIELAVAALVFVALHILPAIRARNWLVNKIGDPAYMALFSLASVLGLAWMIYAYGNAPASEPLWVTGKATRWLTAIAMLIPFILLVCGTFAKNPTSILGKGALGSRNEWNNIFAVTRHPVMWAVAIWAVLHLLNRPDATSALFFGPLAFLAIGGTLMQEERKQKEYGKAWEAFTEKTTFVPFAGLISGKSTLDVRELGGWPLAIAIFLWTLVLYFHGSLFGADPLAY